VVSLSVCLLVTFVSPAKTAEPIDMNINELVMNIDDYGERQNYLREQPDNIKSFNIVGETAQFVNLVYSNINSQNIDLCVQLFETLNEFTVVRPFTITLLFLSK